MRFTKMQGAGNDYIYVDASREEVREPESLARRISDRHFGVGSDGLVLILPGNDEADFEMRMFNADGSEAQMCGNASRCVGKYVYDRGLTDRTELRLKTGSGIRLLRLDPENGKVKRVTVDMGRPETVPGRIPVRSEYLPEGTKLPVGIPLSVGERVFSATCVSMGNPHCVVFVEDPDRFEVEKWGRGMECHPAFPDRVNTEFARVLDRHRIRMRVWERGSGETMACGTGACATLVAAVLNGYTDRKALLILNGGELEIEWNEKTGHVLMTGPAEHVFDGIWEN